jgi:hypothetical protein
MQMLGHLYIMPRDAMHSQGDLKDLGRIELARIRLMQIGELALRHSINVKVFKVKPDSTSACMIIE